MKTEKINSFGQEVQLPCSRLFNGFRIIPFFTKTKCICWAIRPNKSLHTFAFVSLEHAESFAKILSNNHSEKFWHKRFLPLYMPVHVTAILDGYSISSALESEDYCRFIYNAVTAAVFNK